MTNAELNEAWPEFINADGDWRMDLQSPYASRDGWGIYGGPSSYRFVMPNSERRQLQKRTGVDIFENDEQAAVYMWKEAARGHERSRAALLYLRHKYPREYEAIRKYCMENA